MYRTKDSFERNCAEDTCNEIFVTEHKKQMYCSKSCGNRTRNRKRRRKEGCIPLDEWNTKRSLNSRKTKRTIVENVKLKAACADCGLQDPVVFEFDHIVGTKINDISRIVRGSYTVDELKIELNKCEVVCANCHRRRTSSRH